MLKANQMYVYMNVIPMLKVFKKLENLWVGLKPPPSPPRSSGSVGYFQLLRHAHAKSMPKTPEIHAIPTTQPLKPLQTLLPQHFQAHTPRNPHYTYNTATPTTSNTTPTRHSTPSHLSSPLPVWTCRTSIYTCYHNNILQHTQKIIKIFLLIWLDFRDFCKEL